jgi:PelA/Pel-15E family pectate lyase
MICLLGLSVWADLTIAQSDIGHNQSYQGLDPAQFEALAESEKSQWHSYFNHNLVTKKQLMDALSQNNIVTNLPPRPTSGKGSNDPNIPDPKIKPKEAQQVGLSLISYQLPTGGWGKNRNWLVPERQAHQAYVVDTSLAKTDPLYNSDPGRYLGTIDNDATISEIRYLAKLATILGRPESQKFETSVLKGLDYLVMAQYPNGGFPQIYPLEGGYHDAITFNDNAMISALSLLKDAASGADPYAFIPKSKRALYQLSYEKGLINLLNSQYKINNMISIWPQQVHPISLAPLGGRAFEPPALSTSESTKIIEFLFDHQANDGAIQNAAISGALCLKALLIEQKSWVKDQNNNYQLITDPKSSGVWARFYDLNAERPLFGDRDGKIYDQIDPISTERRNGYAWYTTAPAKVISKVTKSKLMPSKPQTPCGS